MVTIVSLEILQIDEAKEIQFRLTGYAIKWFVCPLSPFAHSRNYRGVYGALQLTLPVVYRKIIDPGALCWLLPVEWILLHSVQILSTSLSPTYDLMNAEWEKYSSY